MATYTTLNKAEIDHFTKDSAHWWDENGPFKPLHKLNPVRMHYIRQQIVAHFGLNDSEITALKGLKILDIGCGGGLVSESLARLGADVTGIDADPQAIDVAKSHSTQSGLHIQYICGVAEDLTSNKKKYDVVLGLEVIEHVDNPVFFVETISKLLTPKGLSVFSTLNRTPKSYALGIIAAEYLLRWVPVGTHNWDKFVKPSELGRMCSQSDFITQDITGLIYNPLKDEFVLSKKDIAVNYFLTAIKQ